MSGPRARLGVVLLLLVGGITWAFLAHRGEGGGRGTSPAGRRTAEGRPAAASVFDAVAPRLRGLPPGEDGAVQARVLVERVLQGLAGSPRPAIQQALASEDWGVQWAGLLAIPRYGEADEAVQAGILRALGSDVRQVRRTAAVASGYLSPRLFAPLEAALEAAAAAPQPRVRSAALRALARRTRRRVELVPLFERALEDEDGDARSAGAYGLAQLELQERLPPAAVARLRPKLARALDDPVTDVVVYAVMALGRAGAQAAGEVPAICALLDDERALVRGQAATALGSIGAPALPLLEDELRTARGRRVPSLLWALRQIGPPAFGLLLRTLQHEQPVVRVLAAQKLWELEHETERALDVLIAAVEGDDGDALRIAARTLARMGTEGARAVPALEQRTDHPDETVRSAVASALERLRPDGG